MRAPARLRPKPFDHRTNGAPRHTGRVHPAPVCRPAGSGGRHTEEQASARYAVRLGQADRAVRRVRPEPAREPAEKAAALGARPVLRESPGRPAWLRVDEAAEFRVEDVDGRPVDPGVPAPRPEPARAELDRPAPVRPDPPRPLAARPDSPRPDSPRPAPRPEPPRPERDSAATAEASPPAYSRSPGANSRRRGCAVVTRVVVAVTPALRVRSRTSRTWSSVISVMTVPLLPARAVRPERCR